MEIPVICSETDCIIQFDWWSSDKRLGYCRRFGDSCLCAMDRRRMDKVTSSVSRKLSCLNTLVNEFNKLKVPWTETAIFYLLLSSVWRLLSRDDLYRVRDFVFCVETYCQVFFMQHNHVKFYKNVKRKNENVSLTNNAAMRYALVSSFTSKRGGKLSV